MVKISIVTISYNQSQFLPRCFASIVGQRYFDYEHIIVDPGSTDGSREWITSNMHPRMRPIFDSDNGPAQGLNHGLAAASGELFMYLNADDELAPGALADIAEHHDRLPAVDVIIGNGWTIDRDGSPLRFVKSDRFTLPRHVLGVATVLQQSTIFKMRVLETGVRFNEANRCSWDSELLLDCYLNGASISNVSRCWGYFRLHDESITMSARYLRALRNESARISKRVTPLPGWLLGLLSYPARLQKKLLNLAENSQRAPFPGLVNLVLDTEQ
jgi:glycosyltransferase involved in cell wall biosynthesis